MVAKSSVLSQPVVFKLSFLFLNLFYNTLLLFRHIFSLMHITRIHRPLSLDCAIISVLGCSLNICLDMFNICLDMYRHVLLFFHLFFLMLLN